MMQKKKIENRNGKEETTNISTVDTFGICVGLVYNKWLIEIQCWTDNVDDNKINDAKMLHSN